MTLHKADAIVLKRDRSGESSLLVELLLKNSGKVSMMAKGARNPGSALVGRLEPFSEIELLYYQKTDESLGMISQVTQKNINSEISSDIRRLSYASAVVELIKGVVATGTEQAGMFKLVTGTLYMLNYCMPRKLEFFFLVFLLKSLDLMGLSPQLDRCVKTGEKIEDEEILFSIESGGIISKSVADENESFFKLDMGIINALKKSRESDIDKLKGLNFTDKQKIVIRDLLFAFVSYHTGSKPSFKSLNFLTKLANFQ